TSITMPSKLLFTTMALSLTAFVVAAPSGLATRQSDLCPSGYRARCCDSTRVGESAVPYLGALALVNVPLDMPVGVGCAVETDVGSCQKLPLCCALNIGSASAVCHEM
ncbi:hypothetical protein BKA70DRAFT_1278420, partial [Coprinopsis sp. MPI-PUGE-AT-0042]